MYTQNPNKKERALLVGLITPSLPKSEAIEHLNELSLLASTAGAEVIHCTMQSRKRIDPATLIGSGKAIEIGKIVEQEKIDIVIFDHELSPVQIRNLEKVIKCKITDRSGIILDIFASRAKTKEAITQVELAQLQYILPRLTRQWTHLSKQYGGIGTRGPGEQQIEVDRRQIRHRIQVLKKHLESIKKEREVQRQQRKEFTRIALVGYTNAGKSTLFNLFTSANVFVEDQLFATLDTTVRVVEIPPSKKVLLSDTVGFIRKLPAHLIASFKSTLMEVVEADILLHVVDISHPRFEEHIEVVKNTLKELGALQKQIITVFNKIDKISDRSLLSDLHQRYQPAVFISAVRGINIGALQELILHFIEQNSIEQTLVVPISEYQTIAQLYNIAKIIEQKYIDNTIQIRFQVDSKNIERLKKILGRKHFLEKPLLSNA